MVMKKQKDLKKQQNKRSRGRVLGDNLPTIQIMKKKLDNQLNIIDLIVMSKLENSKSEIRRLIKGNGVKINNQTISDEKMLISKTLFKDNLIKLSLGKKKHIKVELI